MRKLGISINNSNIIIKAIELYPSFKGKNYKTLKVGVIGSLNLIIIL